MTLAQAQLQNLAQLQKQIGVADIVTLAGLRAEVSASVAAAQSTVHQAQRASAGSSAGQAALYEASQEARHTATDFVRDFYDRHVFDKYLEFADAKDRDEYRKREEDRRHAIGEALAEHTPEGTLRALELERDQLKDAGAHGATRSPEYKRTMDDINAKDDALASALAPTKAKAVSTSDPLDAAKPSANMSPELIASLRATGITLPDQSGSGPGVAARVGQANLGRG